MSSLTDVIVVGGGPAGSTAATYLAEKGYDVHLIEKQRMPREKLCGEFLSTEVAETCRRMGVFDRLVAAGAREIRYLRMTSTGARPFEIRLPESALAISRQTLDHLLLDRAVEAGVRLSEGTAVKSIEGNLQRNFYIRTRDSAFSARVVLGAFGRQNRLNQNASSRQGDRSPYVAFKAHFSGVDLADAVELHAFPGGYCGLLSEDRGLINACWIGHRQVLKDAGSRPDSMLRDMIRHNPALASRFGSLHRVSSYAAASQLVFSRESLFSGDVCLLGDAAGMIAPLCGDGMAMAIASAESAAGLVDAVLSGQIDHREYRRAYRRFWIRRFRRRMLLGRVMHAGFVRPSLTACGLRAATWMPWAARAVVRATRG